MARILVVDEDALLRANLSRLLALEGHEVIEADGGERAVELALAGPPDLVLCDLVMPDLDGQEVTRRLRADPRTAGVPIVIVTGSASVASESCADALGADACVTKPFELDHLLAVVSRLLQGR